MNCLSNLKLFLLAASLMVYSTLSFAADSDQTHALMTAQEQELHLKAKKRIYAGGRDEEPLKVQSQLQSTNRKQGPATEGAPAEDAPTEGPTD